MRMTLTDTILDTIDVVTMESQIDVYESMCNVYDKALAIIEECETSDCLDMFTIVQESASDDEKKDDKKDVKKDTDKQGNILVRMMRAISGFFKMIGITVANIFRKNKAGVSDKLRSLSKKSETECKNVQEKIDDGPTEKKLDSLASSFEESAAPIRKADDSSDGDDSKNGSDDGEKGETKTTIHVGSKKVKTHINFGMWISFLEYADEWSTNVITKMGNVGTAPSKGIRLKGVNDDAKKGIRDKFYEFIDGGKNIKRSRFNKKKMFTFFCKKYSTMEVADNIDKINALLDKNIKSANTAYEKFDKLTKALSTNDDAAFKGLAKEISSIHTELANISKIVVALAKYIGMELKLYDSMLNIIIPMFDKAEKAAKDEEIEKKTIHVKVGKEKDDEEDSSKK